MNYRDLESVHIISDDPEAVKALVAAAKTGQFEHVAQRQRDARDLAEATAGLRAEPLTADGVPVIDAPRYDEKKITRLWDLGTAEAAHRRRARRVPRPGRLDRAGVG